MYKFTKKSKFDREFGHFVSVLIYIDLRKLFIYHVLIERIDFSFFVDIDYETC